MAIDVMQKVFSDRNPEIGVVCQPSKNGTVLRYTDEKTYQDQETRYTDRFDDEDYYMKLAVGNTSAFSNAFSSGAYG